jgi:hypothetical protein
MVYKVDRLTRALTDFARMVDIFDRHEVAFVSITQQFNTTSSMGRLTLNVLLSFAQFEREVPVERIRNSGPAVQRAFLLEVVDRIQVAVDCVSISVRSNVFYARLTGQESETTGNARETKIRIDIPVKFKKRGVEMKLIITDERLRPPDPDPFLITAVAQGRQWFDQIRSGDVRSVRDLAERHGVNQGDVSRILPLGLLAPDIIEAILAGRQPVGLTATNLKRRRDLPLSWAAQRQLLGFS